MKFLVFCLFGLALGQSQLRDSLEDNWAPQQNLQLPREQLSGPPESAAAAYLGLASGATQAVPNIRTTFSCVGRRYGYFADVDNNCQVFHVCHPSTTAKGEPVMFHYSQYCPAGTRFDQRQLTCLQETSQSLIPCQDSTRYYPLVESRFAEVPVVQQGFQSMPQTIEQVPIEQIRHDTYPVKGIQSQVRAEIINYPTKNIARAQPLVQQQLVTPVQYQRKTIQQVQQVPLVTRYVQTVPVQTVPIQGYSSIPQSVLQPVPQTVQSQPLVSPAVKQRAQQQLVQVPQAVPMTVQQQPIPQALPVQSVQQPSVPMPVEQPVPVDQRAEVPSQLSPVQPQTVSMVQPMEQLSVQQPMVQSVYQPIGQEQLVVAREDGNVQRPSSRVSPLNQRHQEFMTHTSA